MYIVRIIIFVGLILKLVYCERSLAERLKARFYDTSYKCLDSKNHPRPAYECSGLMMRGVDLTQSKLKYAWSLSKKNKNKGSISFAFFRNDQLLSQFPRNYDTGYIIYPHLRTPAHRKKNKNKVYCAFPLDAHTDARTGRHGCGRSNDDVIGTSVHCDLLGVKTINAWKWHYSNIVNTPFNNLYRNQCGFDMTTSFAANYFAVCIQATYFLQSAFRQNFYINNELRIETWNDNNCGEIPIEAFFYIADSPGAREKAIKHQKQFRDCSGHKVPVVGFRLPIPPNRSVTVFL